MEWNNLLGVPGSAKDGVIKYQMRWTQGDCISEEMVHEIRMVRKALFQKGLIGVGADGIGYGNLSRRCTIPMNLQQDRMQQEGFLISGSQTGHLENPGPEGYSYVPEWSIPGNWVCCVGLVAASSESLTHAAVYEYSPEIQGVVHVHSPSLWKAWKNGATRTSSQVAYGTPAMAMEIRRLMRYFPEGRQRGLVCMGGHQDGILAWGSSLVEAAQQILQGELSRA